MFYIVYTHTINNTFNTKHLTLQIVNNSIYKYIKKQLDSNCIYSCNLISCNSKTYLYMIVNGLDRL